MSAKKIASKNRAKSIWLALFGLIFIFTLPVFLAAQEEPNPLLSEFKTPFGTPPFDLIKNEHFLPAIKKVWKLSRLKLRPLSIIRSLQLLRIRFWLLTGRVSCSVR